MNPLNSKQKSALDAYLKDNGWTRGGLAKEIYDRGITAHSSHDAVRAALNSWADGRSRLPEETRRAAEAVLGIRLSAVINERKRGNNVQQARCAQRARAPGRASTKRPAKNRKRRTKKPKTMYGAQLATWVREVVFHDLPLIARLKVSPAMPADISEPLVCHLMGWTWITGRGKVDAEHRGCRYQLKYSKDGYVSLAKQDLTKWDFLVWTHAPAPTRLPRYIVMFPAATLRGVPMGSGSVNFSTIAKHCQGGRQIRAYALSFASHKDFINKDGRCKLREVDAGDVLDRICDDI